VRLSFSRPLAALVVAGGALALVPGTASAGLTGEDVRLHLTIGSDYSATATIYSSDHPTEAFTTVISRASSTPDAKTGGSSAHLGGGGDASQPAVFTVVSQGGGPVLDTFYVTVVCTSSGSCSETVRDLTSHP